MTPDALALLDSLPPVLPGHDRVVVVGGASNTLDLLRLATVRSDDVVLFCERPGPAIRRFAERFAVEVFTRAPQDEEISGANVVLVSVGDAEYENRLVRQARRFALPVHVTARPQLSDFTLIEMLERRPTSFAKDPGPLGSDDLSSRWTPRLVHAGG